MTGVAVVTGASRGIGRAVCVALARTGATIVAAARSAAPLGELVAAVERDGGTGLAVECDVTDDAAVAGLAQRAVDAFGGVDLLVNNAGAYRSGAFLDHSIEDFRSIMDVNWLGTVRVTRALLPGMVAAGRGRIINIASTAGKYGSLYQSPYNSSKHAVVGLTRCLALETAQAGIRVNAICPGFVETELIGLEDQARLGAALHLATADVVPAILRRVPMGRFVTPEEVAAMAVYLASPAADAITGQAFNVDGGLVLV